MISRRDFATSSVKTLLAAVVLGSVTALGGCISLPALINIISASLVSLQALVAPFLPPGAAAALTLVKAALSDLSGAIQQYDAAPAADKATLLAKIDLLLNAFISNFQGFISQVLPGAGTVVTLIEGLASLILSTIAAIRGALPNPPSSLRGMAVNGVQVTPVERNAKQFRTQWNGLCVAQGHPEAQLQ